MTFAFGKKSVAKFDGVHPDLVRVARRAIEITEVDFGAYDGVRTVAEQAEYVRNGTSWTMNGAHILGLALDLVPFVGGKFVWDWEACYKVAAAMQKAAIELNTPIIWGGVWDKRLNDLSQSLESETKSYAQRRKKLGKRVFLDAPHFELDRKVYA